MEKKHRTGKIQLGVIQLKEKNIPAPLAEKIPEEGTILERFQEYLKTYKKKRDIIYFLSCINSQLLVQLGMTQLEGKNIPAPLAEEIVEFAEYFDDNFYDIMFDDMMNYWGQDPLILRLAETIMHEQ